MEYYAAIDVSLELSGVCVVDGTGKIVREAKVASAPEALVTFFRDLNLVLTRVGLEAGPLSQWLHAGLTEAGLPAILIETRHVKAALTAMTVKTDRNDARGMAQLMQMGWFRPVHVKTPPAQEIRALLTGRKMLQTKLKDVELGIRGLLRGFGLKVGKVSAGKYEAGSASWCWVIRCWSRLPRRCCRRVPGCGRNSASCTACCCRSCVPMRTVAAL